MLGREAPSAEAISVTVPSFSARSYKISTRWALPKILHNMAWCSAAFWTSGEKAGFIMSDLISCLIHIKINLPLETRQVIPVTSAICFIDG